MAGLINILPAKRKGRRRLLVLCALLVIQCAITAYCWLSLTTTPSIGFLVKTGPQYLVIWKYPEQTYKYISFSNPETALKFAQEALHLSSSKNPVLELEHVWLQDRFGGYQVMWKTTKNTFLFQMTFQSKHAATLFAHSFRQGAYSPSPYGHSILLLPTATN